jgi:hypothetical protein
MVRMLPPYKHAKSLAYGYRKWTQVLGSVKKRLTYSAFF